MKKDIQKAVWQKRNMRVDLMDMEPNTELKHSSKGMMIAPTQRIHIESTVQGILIRPEGYGEKTAEKGQGSPILIEQYKGNLRVMIWGDINKEEPTHIIELDKAKEANRNEN